MSSTGTGTLFGTELFSTDTKHEKNIYKKGKNGKKSSGLILKWKKLNPIKLRKKTSKN